MREELQFGNMSHYPEKCVQIHQVRFKKGSFSPYLAKWLAREVNMNVSRAPLKMIERYTYNAEEQYYALQFFYKLMFKRDGRTEEAFKKLQHNYRPLTSEEQQRIMQMKLANMALVDISRELNRYISTIHYFLKRKNML